MVVSWNGLLVVFLRVLRSVVVSLRFRLVLFRVINSFFRIILFICLLSVLLMMVWILLFLCFGDSVRIGLVKFSLFINLLVVLI